MTLRAQVEAFDQWRQRLMTELAQLPDTLARIREGSVNFELVGRRLADSTEKLEEITRVYESTVAGSARRTAETADSMRRAMEDFAAQSPDRLTATMRDSISEMQRTAEQLAELNPFFRRRPLAD